MKTPDGSFILQKIDEFNEYVDQLSNDNVKKKILKMLDKFGLQFYHCPASTSEDRHCCYPGGLVVHSLNVFSILLNLVNQIDSEVIGNEKITRDDCIICGLFHDLGKVGEPNIPYYVDNENQWWRSKGKLYETNKNLLFIDSAVRSITTLFRNGIELTQMQIQAILCHDGQYVEGNKEYQHKETTFALLLHHADMLACHKEKRLGY